MAPRYLLLLPVLVLATILRSTPAPAQTGAPFSFLAIGDAGEVGDELSGNARHMLEQARLGARRNRPIGLLLFLGDNVYPHGFNGMTPKRREMAVEQVFGPHRELLGMLGARNVHAVPGNHDYYCTALEGLIPYGTCDLGNQYEAQLDFWTYHYHFPAIVRRALAAGSADSVDIILFDSALLMNQQSEKWSPVLDSLEKLLRISGAAKGVTWRILASHHSPYSVGAHGGYRLWLPKEKRVGYIGNCIDDGQDPYKYVQEMVSNQDNCSPHYRLFSDSLMALIARTGTRVQLLMAGHDHSLQLLNYPDSTCATCPKIFIINGAGSKRDQVRSSQPPRIFTHPFNTAKEKGKSAAGFTLCTFTGGKLEISFIESEKGSVLKMGGVEKFTIDTEGRMTTQ